MASTAEFGGSIGQPGLKCLYKGHLLEVRKLMIYLASV
jgi:hypothetical protein